MKKINKISKPSWLKTNLPTGSNYLKVKEIISKNKLHTICTSGKCPNMAECWGNGTATFMILGEICTRSCKFCATKTGKPLPLDKNEPIKIARSVKLLKLKHCVITSVDRDDLDDGGASHWASTIFAVKKENPDTTVEVLIPDFNGKKNDIDKIIKAMPDIISHNLETVQRLSPLIRNKAKYELSLEVLKYLSEKGIVTKSGIMVGLGESESEIYHTIADIKKTGCSIITIGQYLQPTIKHWPVKEYIHPDVFSKFKSFALNSGFKIAESAPLVRSSYHAETHI